MLKSPPHSQAAGVWLWILEVIPTRVSQKTDLPFTHQSHSQLHPAGAQWSQEDIHYCIYQEMGGWSKEGKSRLSVSFWSAIWSPWGEFMNVIDGGFLHLLIFSPWVHPSEWTADLSLFQVWCFMSNSGKASHGDLMFGYQADVINI